MKFGIIN